MALRFSCKHKNCYQTFGTEEEAEEHYEKEHLCPVCTSDYTSYERKKITCDCGFSCCKKCLKDYIKINKDDKVMGISCFKCSKDFSLEFLMEHDFGKDFFRKLIFPKIINKEVDDQLKMLPATQKFAKYEEDLTFWKVHTKKKYEATILTYREIIRDLQREMLLLRPVYDGKEDTVYNFKCPTLECHGYVDNQGKCGICSKIFCLECREEKKEGHLCNPDILQNIEYLKSESKPCPHCGISTIKKDGCDQMWCFNCKNFWDWKTNEKILITSRRQIHNPDFFQWERTNNQIVPRGEERMSDQIPQGWQEFINEYNSNKILKSCFTEPKKMHENIWFCEQKIRSLRADTTHYYRNLRSKVLRGILKEEEFKKKVLLKKRQTIRDHQIANIIEESCRQKKLILRNILDHGKNFDVETIRINLVTTNPIINASPLSEPRRFVYYIFKNDRDTAILRDFFDLIKKEIDNYNAIVNIFETEARKINSSYGFTRGTAMYTEYIDINRRSPRTDFPDPEVLLEGARLYFSIPK